MVAVVSDVHYRMSLALIRDLAQAGVEVITCERARCRDNPASPALGALSRHTARHVWLPEEGYGDALLDLCRELAAERGRRPALLPVGAATLALLSEERARFAPHCGLCVPTPEQLALLNSKERVAALAEELGIPVPDRYVRREGETAEDFLRRVPLPCVVKPVCGEKLGLAAAERYLVARDRGKALEAYAHFSRLAGEAPLVQEYLPGGGLGCSVLAREGRVIAAICHRRVREYPVSGGPSSCCVCVDEPEARARTEQLVRKTGYTGLAMFEFKEDAAGRPRLLEVNPRIWGTFPLTRASGSGIPWLWFLLAWNDANPEAAVPLPPAPRPRTGRRMIFAASDAMAALQYAKRGQPGRSLAAAGDFLRPGVRDGLFEWGDPLPALAYVRSLLKKKR